MSILNIDIRFVDVSYELGALGRYLDMLEQQLNVLIKQEHEKAETRIQEIKKNFDEVEWQIAHQVRDELVENLIPRFFRSPFLVTLWATYESGIIEIANYLQKQKCLSLSIRDIKGKHFLNQAYKYFEHVLKFTLWNNSKAKERLEMLRVLRNTIAHSNGLIERIKNEKDKEKIKKWEENNLGVSTVYGNLIFTKDFLGETYQIVNDSLNNLINRAKNSV